SGGSKSRSSLFVARTGPALREQLAAGAFHRAVDVQRWFPRALATPARSTHITGRGKLAFDHNGGAQH
ncbi:MAG TPA: hypothetical protein VGD78_05905, partial [Chthoniobacterales bacterium]